MKTNAPVRGKVICYLKTLKELDMFFKALWNFGAIYINHEYQEQKSYIKGSKMYDPLRCKTCGHISVAWKQL